MAVVPEGPGPQDHDLDRALPPDDPRPTILVGIDGSETSLNAGAYAAGMARRLHARAVALYVHPVGGFAAAAPSAVVAMAQTSTEVATELREMIADQIRRSGEIDVSFVERSGNPYTEIMRLAEELKVDAVVVGASMQAGHRLVGSLAVHLVRAAKWPITVVP